ncbi:hypothetical protein STVIR_2386 [Streptomyces viridochromogenes Tue57]|uniref:Uncharacterized protein n=1 Tax=Streptomyces viridochromogenes Tue57 TaxID=1160705 RepID=L8PJI8_STRVR|nr:hypothetical protein STVIR_2386 [Streptomyces viridochromogenes Tue57]
MSFADPAPTPLGHEHFAPVRRALRHDLSTL